MGKYQYVICMKLPSLNDYVRMCRSNKYQAAKYKRDIENMIGFYLIKMPKWEKPIRINFTWIESTKRRDLDNIAFSKKFILDSMVKTGKIKDDTREYVVGFSDSFVYGEKTKVIVEIEEVS